MIYRGKLTPSRLLIGHQNSLRVRTRRRSRLPYRRSGMKHCTHPNPDGDNSVRDEAPRLRLLRNSWPHPLSLFDVQVFPKRCGHLDGKTLVPTDQFSQKVERAVAASKKATDGQFIVCARTDARGVEGLEAVVDRSKAYIDAGADMIFPEGLASEEGLSSSCRYTLCVVFPLLVDTLFALTTLTTLSTYTPTNPPCRHSIMS